MRAVLRTCILRITGTLLPNALYRRKGGNDPRLVVGCYEDVQSLRSMLTQSRHTSSAIATRNQSEAGCRFRLIGQRRMLLGNALPRAARLLSSATYMRLREKISLPANTALTTLQSDQYALGTVQLSFLGFRRTTVVKQRKCSGRYAKPMLLLNILVRCFVLALCLEPKLRSITQDSFLYRSSSFRANTSTLFETICTFQGNKFLRMAAASLTIKGSFVYANSS